MTSKLAKTLTSGSLVTVRTKAYKGMIFTVTDILKDQRNEVSADSTLILAQAGINSTFSMRIRAHDCDVVEGVCWRS